MSNTCEQIMKAEVKYREQYYEKFAAVQAGEITHEEWMKYCSMVLEEIFAEEEE